MPVRLPRRLLVCLACCASLRAGPLLEQTWFFTTDHRLTIDVRLAADVAPDWAASSVTLTPAHGAPIRRMISPALVAPSPTAGARRIVLDDIDAALWSPAHPNLYRATLDVVGGGHHEAVERRVGFRAIAAAGGQLLLNGRPIFLRGFAINPPGRGIPETVERSRGFAADYVRYLLSLHVNIIRIPDDDTWYDVCDELGMMVFGGNYAGRVNGAGADGDRAAAVRWFREEKFAALTPHPALVIYALTNEVAYAGAAGARWDAFLGDVYRQLQPWDPTRLYIANAGYGAGRVGEINDIHRYWGWYYESPFTFLHLRDYPPLVVPAKLQPLTFTECVGNYNGPDGRVNLTPNHKNPPAQLAWTGHAPSTEQGTLEFEHQSFTIRQATELFRRLRPINPELAGVFPFTILFNHWHDIGSFADMDPKPAAAQLRASYQPVLVSWELYTPQVYAGTELKPIAHLVNDADDQGDLHGAMLAYELRDAAQRAVAAGRTAVPDVAYYATARLPLALKIPESAATGNYTLVGTLVRDGATISENRTALFVADPAYARAGATPGRVRLFDPNGATARAFGQLGLAFTAVSSFTADTAVDSPVVIGESVADQLDAAAAGSLADFVRRGGRLLLLRQPSAAVAAVGRLLPAAIRMPATDIDDPAYPPPPRPARNSFNVNPERPDHPVFAGIDRRQLRVWSDYSGWDEQKPGFPTIHPVTNGFVLTNKADIRATAILANYGPGLEGNALAEFFAGDGSVIFCGFDLAARSGRDPVADRLLRNLIGYVAQRDGHDRYPLIDAPIVWGRYETEKGVLTGINSGLLLNSRPALTGSYRDIPITVSKEGHEFAGGAAGWNTRPGIAYVPFGRRPFGPYIHRGWSGVAAAETANPSATRAVNAEGEELETPPPGLAGEGEGRFWCRVPAGRTRAVHRVFNPSTEKLPVRLRANDRETTAMIGPGATAVIAVPLDPAATSVESFIRGDRRLVLLETAFE